MSQSYASSAGSSGGFKPLEALSKLASPRENAKAPTIVQNVSGIVSTTWDLLKKVVSTTVDAPLALTEGSVAVVNNSIGLITQAIDKVFVQNVDAFRTRMSEVLNNPINILSGKSGATGRTPAGH